jgi:hypothetical protein
MLQRFWTCKVIHDQFSCVEFESWSLNSKNLIFFILRPSKFTWFEIHPQSSLSPLPVLKTQVINPSWFHNFHSLSLSLSLSKHPFLFFTSFASVLPLISTLHLLCSRVSPLCIRLVFFFLAFLILEYLFLEMGLL